MIMFNVDTHMSMWNICRMTLVGIFIICGVRLNFDNYFSTHFLKLIHIASKLKYKMVCKTYCIVEDGYFFPIS